MTDCKHNIPKGQCVSCLLLTCRHGVDFTKAGADCKRCDDEEEHWMREGCEDDDDRCEHGIPESDCLDCGAKMDRLADQARERQDWDHWHPAE